MKKVRLVIVARKSILSLFIGISIIVVVLCLNLFYFLELNSALEVSSQDNSIKEQVFNTSKGATGKLAIIIDDFGQNRNGVKEMMSIDRHLTFAVMPFLTFSYSDAIEAHKRGYEVIVHLPMESYNGRPSWVGPRPILAAMTSDEISRIVLDAFADIPYASGANIHMGSKAGEDAHVISAVLNVIKEKNLYFVDSRSCRHPIAKKIADAEGVNCYDRDVFLDGKKNKDYIIEQIKLAGEIALKKGKAVAIGHVGTEGGKVTAEAIQEMLPVLENNNIELVFISELKE